MIGKGTGQPGLDAESHGRNSPATTVRKQEGRALQGQQERSNKQKKNHTSKFKTESRVDKRPGKGAPPSQSSSLMDGAVSGEGQRGGKCFSHSSPPAPWRPQHLQPFPTGRGAARAGRSGEGSASIPRAAQPSPGKPARFSQTRAVMAGMWGLVQARQPAEKLLSHGLQHQLYPLPQCHRPSMAVTATWDQEPLREPCSIHSHSPTLPGSPAQPAADTGSEERRAGLFGFFY